jgi:hypothetical protein
MANEFITATMFAAGKTEAVAGTAETITSGDVELLDVGMIEVDTSEVRLGNPATGNLKKAKWLHGMERATVSFNAVLKGNGDPLLTIALAPYLRMAGLTEHDGGATPMGWEYASTPSCETMTFIHNEYACGPTPVGTSQGIRGMVANITISAEAPGAPVMLAFECSGMNIPETNIVAGAPLGVTGEDTGACQKFISSPFDIGGTVQMINSFSLTLQAVVAVVPDAGNANGGVQFKIVDADPQLTVTLVDAPLTVIDYYNEMMAETETGTAQIPLQNFDIDMTGLQLQSTGRGDLEGIVSRENVYSLETFDLIQK